MIRAATIPRFTDCAAPDDPQFITKSTGGKFAAKSYGKIICVGTVGECLTALHNVKGGSYGSEFYKARSN